MKNWIIVLIMMNACLSLPAQSLAGTREDFDRLVREVQSSPSDVALRERVIAAALALKPPPTVPELALRFEGRAEAAISQASKPQDYLNAAREYREALRIAPWQTNTYFNLGIVLEKAGHFDEAIRNFRLYLVGNPNARDRNEVIKRIAGLEYKVERTSPAAVAASKREALTKLAASLEGAKFVSSWWQSGGRFELHVRNGQLVFGFFDPEILAFRSNRQHLAADYGLMGAARYALTGTTITPFATLNCNVPSRLEIAADGRSATVHRACPDSTGALTLVLRREP